jgi:hypothetical protein
MSTKIQISKTDSPVIVNVSCPSFPQSIVGIIYRYAADQTKEGQVGQFRTAAPNVTLGNPSDIDGKLFSVLTQVLPFNDDPPSPYEIVVTVSQEGKQLSSEVPVDNGSGTISTDIITSLYYFSIQAI